MMPVHIKLHRSAVTLPFDHVRIVQIDLHKVLLLSVVAIERPVRPEKEHINILHVNLGHSLKEFDEFVLQHISH